MIDLHTHTFFSDGCLSPSELVYRAKLSGYEAIAICDHLDQSNLDFVIPRISKVCDSLTKEYGIIVVPGAEITYVPPRLIASVISEARKLGAHIIVVHGETPAEKLPPGTNHEAILAGTDVLAHPGLITEEDVALAKSKGVCLEITARKMHSSTNRHVAELAKRIGAELVLDTDSHEPEDLINDKKALEIVKACGLKKEDLERMFSNSRKLINRRIP